MKKVVLILCLIPLISLDVQGQSDFVAQPIANELSLNTTAQQTVKNKFHRAYFDSLNQRTILRNENVSWGQKYWRATALTLTFQTTTLGVGLLMSKDFTNWSTGSSQVHKENLRIAFTRPPVIDQDPWYINYLGHPYQGSYYYNAYRSQGAHIWQSVLMSAVYSTSWEYLIEGNFERPSIQDMIITPVLGSVLGECAHYLTIRMSLNGYTWYEKVLVSIINPMFALNNGFKYHNLNYDLKW